MKILFLGTSAGWPLPRLGCRCQICQSKNPQDHRLRPTILINDSLLIDCGPDIYHQLKKFKVDPTKINNLILTHAHLDHILGFYDLTHIYNRQKREINLITTQEIFNGFRQFYHLPLKPFKLKVLSLKEVLEIENLKISLYPVPHNHTPTVAVKIKERKIFIYIPDLKRLPKNERKSFREAHLLVLDGSSLTKKGQTKNHQSILEGIRLAKDLNPKFCYFTHIGHLTLPHQELEKYLQQQGKNIFPAYDGLELEI
ncbi:MAG: MBL fold metallo-hydrolase [Microgenomates group bacterium]